MRTQRQRPSPSKHNAGPCELRVPHFSRICEKWGYTEADKDPRASRLAPGKRKRLGRRIPHIGVLRNSTFLASLTV